MGLNRWTLAPSRLLGIGLALVGSGIAFGALFLPWDYLCPIIVSVCADSGPQDHTTLVPISTLYTHGLWPFLLPLPLPFLGLICALRLVFVPAPRRRAVVVLGIVVGLCGVCSTLSMPVLDGLSWMFVPGTLHWDWGIAVSLLGYGALLVGFGFVPFPRAEDTR